MGPQSQRLLFGGICSVLAGTGGALIWGRTGGMAAAMFGLVATAMQLLAARMMARTGATSSVDHLKVYVTGIGFRLLGVLILGVIVSLDRTKFPPVPSAAGYLGTVLPLLFLETRLSR